MIIMWLEAGWRLEAGHEAGHQLQDPGAQLRGGVRGRVGALLHHGRGAVQDNQVVGGGGHDGEREGERQQPGHAPQQPRPRPVLAPAGLGRAVALGRGHAVVVPPAGAGAGLVLGVVAVVCVVGVLDARVPVVVVLQNNALNIYLHTGLSLTWSRCWRRSCRGWLLARWPTAVRTAESRRKPTPPPAPAAPAALLITPHSCTLCNGY